LFQPTDQGGHGVSLYWQSGTVLLYFLLLFPNPKPRRMRSNLTRKLKPAKSNLLEIVLMQTKLREALKSSLEPSIHTSSYVRFSWFMADSTRQYVWEIGVSIESSTMLEGTFPSCTKIETWSHRNRTMEAVFCIWKQITIQLV